MIDVDLKATGPAGARAEVEGLESSKIRDVANAAMGIEGIIALWYGEPDQPTPEFITRAASEALAQGRTFYTENRGIDELRHAIAAYSTRPGPWPWTAPRASSRRTPPAGPIRG
jgi:aspartate/methionine/tyrosine aminotransferase